MVQSFFQIQVFGIAKGKSHSRASASSKTASEAGNESRAE